jgi:spermidine/putrescine transport system permease protein
MASAKGIDLRSQFGFRTIALLCLFVLYFPLLILIVFSINANDIVAVFSGVSTRWYEKAFYNEEFHSAAINTMIIAVTATIVATIFATLAALATTRTAPWRGQTAVYMVINLPLMVPEIITAVATLSFFALLGRTLGLNFGLGNIILAHTVFCIPFAYMPIRARLESMDLTLESAASDLYATPFKAFLHVTLPLLMPGISSGAALAFIVSFDDFTITQLVAGPGQTTLPLYIWAMIRRPMTPEINAISTILLGISVVFILVSFGIAQKRNNQHA